MLSPDSELYFPDATKQQEELLKNKMELGDEEYSSSLDVDIHDEELYGDFILTPRETIAERRIRRMKRAQIRRNKALQAAARSLRIFPEILERICYFASQAALRQTICLVCKSWYFAAAPFMRRKGTWMMESLNAEDILLSRMVTLDTLQLSFSSSAISRQDRQPPHNTKESAFGRFLKTITDPIEDVLPTLQPVHHPLSSKQSHSRSDLYRSATMSAQQARACGKSCLLDFPTSIEFLSIDFEDGLFQSVLPHLRHIRILKLNRLSDGACDLAQILNQCPSMHTFTIDSSSYSYHLSFKFDASNSSTQSYSSKSTSTVVRPTQYPQLVHFSATAPHLTQQTVASLLKVLPSLTYFKTHVIKYYGDHSPPMDLPFLYKHAAEHCPQLALVHITQDTNVPTDPQEITLVQQFFPQITQMIIRCEFKSWYPDLSTFMFFSQMTHLEFLHMREYYYPKFSLDLVLRSAPRLISLRAPSTSLHMYEGGSLEYRHIWYEYDDHGREIRNYRQSSAAKRKVRLARRIAKQLEKNHIRELPHPSLWLCQGLRTADLKVDASRGLFQYIIRQCPQLVDLTLRVHRLAVGQTTKTREHRSLLKWPGVHAKVKQNCYIVGVGARKRVVEYREKEECLDDELFVLAGLERLERLVVHASDIPGELTMRLFAWMGETVAVVPSGPRRKRNTAMFYETHRYWPKLEQFTLSCKQADDKGYAPLWRGLRELRPSVEFMFYYKSGY
ncbi:hypothetical protein BGZ59_003144 [Podila verticillata]|nr:hypothetical protein BGZ59_003144 [Podila verticillata]